MNLEIGDYFTVERGRLLSPTMETPFGNCPPQYDDFYAGAIFEVLIQEHSFIACKIIFPHDAAGCTTFLDVEGLELMTFSQRYVDKLLDGRQFKEEEPESEKQGSTLAKMPPGCVQVSDAEEVDGEN